MLDKKDINKYNTDSGRMPSVAAEDELALSAGATAKTLGSMVAKTLLTLFFILAIAGLLVLVSLASLIWSFRDTEVAALTDYDLKLSSNVYVQDVDGVFKDYMVYHTEENRAKVNFADIPQYMKDAQIAIEDKRFANHHGVDWKTTFNAALNLATGSGGAGGSTLTQQLIKNVTGEDDVSILRKVKEIFSALNLEKKYSKDEILEFYLNLVNYGAGNYGVQAAANTYFGKDIKDCSLAECAAISGITQNPYAYTPTLFPENTKKRQQIVLDAMYKQKYITKAEYDAALVESNNMNYAFKKSETGTVSEVIDTMDVWDWYTEAMFYDVKRGLKEQLNISGKFAEDKIFGGGLEIYSAMDQAMQIGVTDVIENGSYEITDDPDLEMGFVLMDYDGRVQAVVGSRAPKTVNRGFSNAVDARRQPGSSIKPLSVYGPGLDIGEITYGSVLKDQPIEGYFNDGTAGPANFSRGDYRDYMNVDTAVEISQNAPAAHLCTALTPSACLNFMIEKLHFTTLDPVNDSVRPAMATGGLFNGVTVLEMTAAYQVFGNGGNYYKPYTYTHVIDHNGDTILDNRNNVPTKALSEVNANVMNKLLHRPIYGEDGSGRSVQIDGLDIFGKTGTTDDYFDLWFMGGTPYGVAGLWTGYPITQSEIDDHQLNKKMWHAVIQYLWDNFWSQQEEKSFTYSDDLVDRTFCRSSGLLAAGSCFSTATGWYDANNLPRLCNGGSDHTHNGASAVSPSPSPSVEPSATPSATPSAAPSPTPVVTTTPPATIPPTLPPATEPPPPPTPTPTPESPATEPPGETSDHVPTVPA